MAKSNLEIVFTDWIDALRRHDIDAVLARLSPDVVWQGARNDLACHNREGVEEALRDQQRDEYRIDAIELVDAGDQVVLSVRDPQLREIAGVAFEGQSSTVFTLREGRIVHMQDFLEREAALRAAGAEDRANWR